MDRSFADIPSGNIARVPVDVADLLGLGIPNGREPTFVTVPADADATVLRKILLLRQANESR